MIEGVITLVTEEIMMRSASEIVAAMDDGMVEDLEKYYDELDGNSRIVRNKYEIKLLGEGNSAYVMKVTDIHSGAVFALKVGYWTTHRSVRTYIPDGWIGEALSDFAEIVRVYGYDDYYCLMEYVYGDVGGDLMDTELVELDYVGKMDRLIQKVYEYGYGVSDLHLDNVIVDASGDIRVIDVGGYYVLSENYVTLEEVMVEFAKDSENLRNHRDYGAKWYTRWD